MAGKIPPEYHEEILARSIIELVYHANGVIHQYLMNFVLSVLDTKNRESYLAVLTAIAEGENTQSKIARDLKTKHGDLSKSLARLMEMGILTKNGIFFIPADICV